MINKKIASEIAVGTVLILAVAIGGIFWVQEKNSVIGEQSSVIEKPQAPEVKNEVACTMEAKLCDDGSSVGRTGPNCEFAPCPNLSQQNGSIQNEINSINTKFGYEQSLKVIANRGDLVLSEILFQSSQELEPAKYKNKIAYVFESKNRKLTTLYDYVDQNVTILEDKVVSINSDITKEVPENVISFGLEGVNLALNENDDFIELKSKNESLYENCGVYTFYDEKFGWEWQSKCAQVTEDKKVIATIFAVNIDAKKAVLIKKIGL